MNVPPSILIMILLLPKNELVEFRLELSISIKLVLDAGAGLQYLFSVQPDRVQENFETASKHHRWTCQAVGLGRANNLLGVSIQLPPKSLMHASVSFSWPSPASHVLCVCR